MVTAKGDKGDRGLAGPKGDKGETGLVGPMGNTEGPGQDVSQVDTDLDVTISPPSNLADKGAMIYLSPLDLSPLSAARRCQTVNLEFLQNSTPGARPEISGCHKICDICLNYDIKLMVKVVPQNSTFFVGLGPSL